MIRYIIIIFLYQIPCICPYRLGLPCGFKSIAISPLIKDLNSRFSAIFTKRKRNEENNFNLAEFFRDIPLSTSEKLEYAKLAMEDQRISVDKKRLQLETKKIYKEIIEKIIKIFMPFVWGFAFFVFIKNMKPGLGGSGTMVAFKSLRHQSAYS